MGQGQLRGRAEDTRGDRAADTRGDRLRVPVGAG